jgi:hypothetical protein
VDEIAESCNLGLDGLVLCKHILECADLVDMACEAGLGLV